MMQYTCRSAVLVLGVVMLVVVSVFGQGQLPAAAADKAADAGEGCVSSELVRCAAPPTDCVWGNVRDPCHVCDECAKGPSEVCGRDQQGAWQGTCLPGFKCIPRSSAPNGAGRCEWRPLPTFLNPKLPPKQTKK